MSSSPIPEPPIAAHALQYRKDLYEGTAEYYDRFRPPHPPALFDDLRARVPLASDARVLDLACGTGQIAFGLAGHVADVWAIDQEAEAVAFGGHKARRLGVTNIRWTVGAAEDVALDGTFDLVAIGNAFHRLDRELVGRRLIPYLLERGCVALIWSDPPWTGDRPWQHVLHDTLERWQDTVHTRDRVPAGWRQAIDRDPHEHVLRRAGLSYEGQFDVTTIERWSVESLAGFVYSTSFLNRIVLGDRVNDFEADLRARLLAGCGDGVFEQDVKYTYQLVRRVS